MELTRVVLVLMVVALLVGTLDARDTKRRKKRYKKKQKKADSDPANLVNLLGVGQCSGDFDVNSLLGSMFLSPTEVDTLVQDTKEEMKEPQARSGSKKRTRYIAKKRITKNLGEISTFSVAGSTQQSNCCKTQMNITAPGMVMMDTRMMSVVHMNHSYQYVQEGECVDPGAKCRDIGICTQIYKYAFMLLYDPELAGKVNPPVRYGRVPVKSHCECMNVGRIM